MTPENESYELQNPGSSSIQAAQHEIIRHLTKEEEENVIREEERDEEQAPDLQTKSVAFSEAASANKPEKLVELLGASFLELVQDTLEDIERGVNAKVLKKEKLTTDLE